MPVSPSLQSMPRPPCLLLQIVEFQKMSHLFPLGTTSARQGTVPPPVPRPSPPLPLFRDCSPGLWFAAATSRTMASRALGRTFTSTICGIRTSDVSATSRGGIPLCPAHVMRALPSFHRSSMQCGDEPERGLGLRRDASSGALVQALHFEHEASDNEGRCWAESRVGGGWFGAPPVETSIRKLTANILCRDHNNEFGRTADLAALRLFSHFKSSHRPLELPGSQDRQRPAVDRRVSGINFKARKVPGTEAYVQPALIPRRVSANRVRIHASRVVSNAANIG